MKQNATIDVDEFVSTINSLVAILNDLRTLGREWKNARKTYTGAKLVQLLGITTVNILDSIAGIMSCCTNDCPELPFEDWDFCKEHGEVKTIRRPQDSTECPATRPDP